MRIPAFFLGLALTLFAARSNAQTEALATDDNDANGTFAYAAPLATNTARSRPTADDFTSEERALIRERLREMDCIIPVRQHPVIDSYLRGYILRNREKSERILGRMPTYFPLFERKLREAGLPDDLKYLAVVESALVPKALSRSGAGGLWQFMPGTGAHFGLRIDEAVDQRADPELATEAAVAFLSNAYTQFGDWSLVLAAYNGGPGRIKRTIDKVGSRDFWKLHPHLPQETRNYVPAFVAAMYLHKYGEFHGLRPLAPTLDEQLPVSIACPTGINLVEVAQATELPLNLVRALNPHCLRDYLPAGPRANCRVPARAAQELETYLLLKSHEPDGALVAEIRARPILIDSAYNADALYQQRAVYVEGGRTLTQVATDLGLSVHHLRVWNPEAATYSASSRELTVYAYGNNLGGVSSPRLSEKFRARRPSALLPALAYRRSGLDEKRNVDIEQAQHAAPNSLQHRAPNQRYTIQRYETLLEIWQRHSSNMTWQEFVSWNSIDGDTRPVPGNTLFIRS